MLFLSMLIIFIAAGCITGLLGLGLLLIWSGLRGKTIDGHPLCGKCNFDLVGHRPKPNRCPECGATIARTGGIKIGHHKQQVPKIVHGSILLVINLSIVGFCWLTTEQPTSANAVAITPTVRTMPISLIGSILRQNAVDARTAGSLYTLIDTPSTTLALNVDTMFSRGLIILGDNNNPANSITSYQLLLFDKQNKVSLPAQPASAVIEKHIHKGVSGKAHRPIDLGRGKTVRNARSMTIAKVSNLIKSQRIDTNLIKAQRTEHIALGQ